MTLLDKAAQTSRVMSGLLSDTSAYIRTVKEVKKIRDQAYTHLKEAVDEIRGAGQFVFKRDKDHTRVYRSEYLRSKNLKRRREAKGEES